jgi:predicted porin
VNKKFLAVSIAALFASAAHAQTSVTLYGIADGDFRIDHTTIGNLKSVGSGGESGNRWGIRGSEDLGGGLKAVFTFEQGFQLDDSSVAQGNVAGTTPNSPVNSTGSRLFSRTSQVGLSSDKAGDILFGRAFTPFYVLWTSVDPMAGGLVGGAQNYAVGNVTRFDNGIYYNSPKFYGVQLTTVYRVGESTTNSVASGSVKSGGNAGNASITYAAGPVLAGYSFMSIKNALDNNTTRTQFGGAAYDFGFLKLHALYFNTRNATTTRLQSYALGVTVPIQSFSLFAQVGRIDNRYKQNNSALQYNDDNFIGTGANYAFSKRTDLYVSYAKQVNQGAAVNVVTDSSIAGLFTTTGTATAPANVTPGFNPWSAQVGIRHRF